MFFINDPATITIGSVMSDASETMRARAGAWTEEEIARDRAASDARMTRARERGPEANLKEAAALSRFANRIAAAAAVARRHDA